jgi:DNA-binding transcriptional MerR regulator
MDPRVHSVYTTAQIARLTGFTVRQLDYWARRSIVTPSIRTAQGSGTRKLYSVDDLTPLLFIRKLKRHGWSTQKIAKAVTTLRDVIDDPNPLRSAVLVDGKGTILALYKTVRGERIVLDTFSQERQQVLEIVLETLVEEGRRTATLTRLEGIYSDG